MMKLRSFAEFNALRKNQLLMFYDDLSPMMADVVGAMTQDKYRDYYFMPQVGYIYICNTTTFI